MTLPANKPVLGVVEQFPFGEHHQACQAIAGMRAFGLTTLRTCVSSADYHAEGGEAWFKWLLADLARAFDLSVLLDAPADRLGAFTALVLQSHGGYLQRLEFRGSTDSNDLSVLGDAILAARQAGLEAVLAAPADEDTLDQLGRSGILAQVATLDLQGVPAHMQWRAALNAARAIVWRYNTQAKLWLTIPCASAAPNAEAVQVSRLLAAGDVPIERIYWSGGQEQHVTEQHVTPDRDPPVRRLIAAGLLGHAPLFRPALRRASNPVLIVGGAGFIGSNLAESFLAEGRDVVILDDLSRPGTERNLAWLADRHRGRLHPMLADLCDQDGLREAVTGASAVFHLAAQVAVTSSLADPRHDFKVNAEGTLNVLEAIRVHNPSAPIVYASTNKVYGQLADVEVADFGERTLPQDTDLRGFGLSERRPLAFCTPYGCSKGVADQYVLDYAKSFGLRSAVLRMSCIYGPRQFGNEDQGWVAHFLVKAFKGESITIFGNGRQVRDVLHVADAVRAYRAAHSSIDSVRGCAFNLGGGPANAVSLHLVLTEIEALLQHRVAISYEGWRAGDQPYFVADTRMLQDATGWRARIGWRDGLRDLADWLRHDLGMPDTATKQRALA